MAETLILVAGGDIYHIRTGKFVTRLTQYNWQNPYVPIAVYALDTYPAWELNKPMKCRVTASAGLTTPLVKRVVAYDPASRLSYEEALYNAEWIQGYEYRVSTQGKIISVDAKNPYKKGTPEQKWWEAGYWAATEESKQMEHKNCRCPKGTPCSECPLNKKPLPDAKVEILLKLHERLAAQDKLLKLAYGEFGQLTYENSPIEVLKKAKIALKGYQDSISSLKTAIGVVKALA